MSCGCCSSSTPNKATCPDCGESAEDVSITTLLHQLKQPWQQSISDGPWFFCQQVGCDTVYFSSEGERFTTAQLRQPVGQKSNEKNRPLCYCFDIRHSDLSDAESARACREFVIDKTRDKQCVCEERNPSGKCCLRDFPKPQE